MPEVVASDVEYEEHTLKNECDNCGNSSFNLVEGETHHAQQICANCGGYQKFVPKPAGEKRTKSTRFSIEQISEHRGYEENRCFFCRRVKEQLGKRETLEVDHIKEIQNEGGGDRLDNLQILCTGCHKLKNHQRLYHNEHQRDRRQNHEEV